MTKPAITRRHIILLHVALAGKIDHLDKQKPAFAELQARGCVTADGSITPLGDRYLRFIGLWFGIPF